MEKANQAATRAALHAKLEEILSSPDSAWIETVSMTLKAMHLRFLQECRRATVPRRPRPVERTLRTNQPVPPLKTEEKRLKV